MFLRPDTMVGPGRERPAPGIDSLAPNGPPPADPLSGTTHTGTGWEYSMSERQRPLLAVVTPDPETVPTEKLEADFLREACELAARWTSRLPASSSWRGACVEIHRACADSLDGRRLLRDLRG